jgi:hypothetical protein
MGDVSFFFVENSAVIVVVPGVAIPDVLFWDPGTRPQRGMAVNEGI